MKLDTQLGRGILTTLLFCTLSLAAAEATSSAAVAVTEQAQPSKPTNSLFILHSTQISNSLRVTQYCNTKCINSDSACKSSCINDLSFTDEDILKRTQKCTTDCHTQPEELISMCIQRCFHYMVDPLRHVVSERENRLAAVGNDGMLVENEFIKTRVRLIGPNGLPLREDQQPATSIPTGRAPMLLAEEEENERRGKGRGESARSEGYRVETVNTAEGLLSRQMQVWGALSLALVAAVWI
ncbi:hypothetical protein LPJ66_003577 [Kickxella alabastrina]|uniref:Uncharacterized protein n=1 Tax=Kickxella alabastrina TaxID=61397 RepID=A0ACC1IP14_9FUNG|nr:hypothetical protein LPJ66_003577 [Kickxella alabastrina]